MRILLFSLLFLGFISPSFAGVVVLNGLTHIHKMEVGESNKGIIVIKNNGDDIQQVVVYQKDFSFNHEGQSFYEESGSMKRSNGSWMIINPQSVLLQGQEKAEIVYEIRVPNTDSLVGSYWSTIMIEPVSAIDTNAAAGGLSVSTVLRYAIQIVTNISDSAKSELTFLDVQFERKDSTNYLLIDAKNIGQNMLRTEMAVEVFDAMGQSMGIFRSTRRRTYPSTSRRYVIKLPELPKGIYESVLVADSENDEVFGVQLTLRIEDD